MQVDREVVVVHVAEEPESIHADACPTAEPGAGLMSTMMPPQDGTCHQTARNTSGFVASDESTNFSSAATTCLGAAQPCSGVDLPHVVATVPPAHVSEGPSVEVIAVCSAPVVREHHDDSATQALATVEKDKNLVVVPRPPDWSPPQLHLREYRKRNGDTELSDCGGSSSTVASASSNIQKRNKMHNVIAHDVDFEHLQQQHDKLLQDMVNDEKQYFQKRRQQEKAFLEIQEVLSRR